METQGGMTAEAVERRRRAGKYLTFALGDQAFGLEILKVREIIGMVPITTVPGTPEAVRGVINLRGKVIPVVDLRAKFAMPTTEQTDETCVIVVQVQGTEMGIVVDRVSEVRDIPEDDIEDAPSFGTDLHTDFILGMEKADGQVTTLLEIEQVLTRQDFSIS
jgi:purine-binding chemotaxis protein CheW